MPKTKQTAAAKRGANGNGNSRPLRNGRYDPEDMRRRAEKLEKFYPPFKTIEDVARANFQRG